jgi:hypothetical protein
MLHRSMRQMRARFPFGFDDLVVDPNGNPPDWRRNILMKNLILAALAALSVTAAMTPMANARDFHNGSTVAGDAVATRMQQTGAY